MSKRVLVLVPFAFDEKGLANRRAQQNSVEFGPDIEFDYRPVKAGPALYDSWHDLILADMSLFEAGLDAQRAGYDAVCIDTMSDSGVNGLRSVLDIPVIGPGRASYLTALMLGSKFSVLTQRDPWTALYKKGLAEPVPVINPGPLTYKLAELMLGLRLSQSRVAYPQPAAPKLEMAHTMMDGAAQAEGVVV